jgi:hypothetical protein
MIKMLFVSTQQWKGMATTHGNGATKKDDVDRISVIGVLRRVVNELMVNTIIALR